MTDRGEPDDRLPPWLPVPLRPGYVALRDNWRPLVLTVCVAAALVGAFYTVAPVRRFVSDVAAAKQSWGYLGSALAAAIAGGLLPECARAAIAGRRYRFTAERLRAVGFDLAFFAAMGALVDGFYRVQGQVFGDAPTPAVAVKKTLVDQLLFSPLLSNPMSAILYRWRELGFDARATASELRRPVGFVRDRLLPIVLPAWAYWVPMNVLTYSLPTDGPHFLLYLFALAGWSLLLVVIVVDARADRPVAIGR